MGMYVPAHFRLKDRSEAIALVRAYPFATVVSIVEGAPIISYLPCTIVEIEPRLLIAAHFARANPHWKHVEAAGATLLFHGPHGYVSAGWYAEPHRDVPTWNYAAVHVTASASLLGETGTRDVLDRLTDDFEGSGPTAWAVDQAEEEFISTQLGGIVGVHFSAESIEAKFKLSQNRNAADLAGALRGLRATGRQSDRDLADLMAHMSKPPLTV